MSLYYTAPEQDIFDEVKNASIKVWGNYDDTYGYSSSKINQIKNMKNIKDNFMTMIAMFDTPNQVMLRLSLSKKSNQAIAERIKDGGTPNMFNLFL